MFSVLVKISSLSPNLILTLYQLYGYPESGLLKESLGGWK